MIRTTGNAARHPTASLRRTRDDQRTESVSAVRQTTGKLNFAGVAGTLTLAVAVASVLATPAQAIELTDFTDPTTQFDEAYLDFTASARDGNQAQASYDAFLNTFYNFRSSTDRRVLNFGANGTYDAARGPAEGADTVDDYGFGLSAKADTYLGTSNDEMFWFGGLDYARRDSAIDDSLGVAAGIGYGRVWNATALAQALRIEAALDKYAILSSGMDDETLLALADVIAREDEYRAEQGEDNYRGQWYADMEGIMADGGLLPESELGALGAVQLDEVLFDEPISARRHGWLVRAGAGVQFSDFSGVSDNDPKLTFQFEYAKPYGLTGQLIELATYEPVFGDDTIHRLNNLLSYTYEVSDRIDWLNSWDLTYTAADDDADTSVLSNRLTSTFLYHLTNQLDLGLTLAALDTDEDPNTDTTNDDVTTTATLGLRYRLK